MKSGLTLGDFGWGSKTFAKMGREKIRLISIFLKVGINRCVCMDSKASFDQHRLRRSTLPHVGMLPWEDDSVG